MPTSAGHIKRSFKRGFLRIHPARHSMELNGARASVKEAKFPTETLPNFKLKGSGDAHRRWLFVHLRSALITAERGAYKKSGRVSGRQVRGKR